MKNNALIRICLYSLLILVLVGILVGTLFVTGSEGKSTAHHTIFDEEEPRATCIPEESAPDRIDEDAPGTPISGNMDFPADKITSLDIDWVAGRVLICAGNVREVTVTENRPAGAEQGLISLSSNGSLKISYGLDTDWLFGISSPEEKDLIITVPQDLELREIELDFASAEVEILDLAGTIREVEIDGASGTCTIENCKVRELNVDTASGDVRFSGELEKLDFDAASANFVGVFRNHPKALNVDSLSGDLELTLPRDCGFTVSLEALSGQLYSDIGTHEVKGAQVYGDGACKISVDGMSGDVKIHFHEQ